jgi:hypothetical protein
LDTTAVPTTLTFITPAGTDVITIDSPAAGQSRISGTSGGVAFESITFTNIQTVLIDTGTNDVAGSDADIITIASELLATGLQSLTITTGSGDDTLDVSAVTTDLVVTIHADGTVSVTDSTSYLARIFHRGRRGQQAAELRIYEGWI